MLLLVFLIHLFTGWGLEGVVLVPWGFVGHLNLEFTLLYAALSAPILYLLFGWRTAYRPVVSYAAVAPITTYYAPTFVVPTRTYYAPAPVRTYYAPAPIRTYYAPAPAVIVPPVTTYYAPAFR